LPILHLYPFVPYTVGASASELSHPPRKRKASVPVDKGHSFGQATEKTDDMEVEDPFSALLIGREEVASGAEAGE
jgi:hypothetical protein